MKNFFIMAALLVLVASPALALSVVNSKHDMVASGFAIAEAGGSTEVCIFCHTPHGAQTIVGSFAPLWNNAILDVTALTGFYNNTRTTNFATDVNKVIATDARLCLSCHDSGVAMPINQPNSGDMIIGGTAMSASARLGTDLSNDHPIGMDLGANPNGIDPNIRTLADIRGTTFGFGEDPFPGDLGNDNINVMYCSTCHNVHDNTPLNIPFLRKSNVASALCKACHIK